jgi:hypothetical protein
MAKETKQPVVFISYSHFDEPEHPGPEEIKWLSFVQKFLRPLEKHGVLRFWDDGRIRGGANWRPEIERELNACDVCILLVSPNSLSSDFILDKEVKPMLERRKNEGVHIYPIHITPTPFEGAEWLTEMQIRPSKDKSLFESPLPEREAKMVAIVKEIARLLEGMATTGKRAARPQHQASNSGQQVIDYGRLPETPYAKLVGRETELKELDNAWTNDKINILSLVADGGVGKSALVNAWLVSMQADQYRGADAVLGWSFFSQGSGQRATSAEPFLNWTLEELGIAIDSTSSTVKAEKLAEAMTKRRVLLVLDGVEPLQHGPGPQSGQLKDHGLRAFLRRFAQMSFAGQHSLVVVTSRLAITDIQRWKDGSAPVRDLGYLLNDEGAELLESYRIHGPQGRNGRRESRSRWPCANAYADGRLLARTLRQRRASAQEYQGLVRRPLRARRAWCDVGDGILREGMACRSAASARDYAYRRVV